MSTGAQRTSFGLAFLMAAALSGCATLDNGGRWGENATWRPARKTVAEAAWGAFWNPNTLVPLAGAAVFATGDLDRRTSDWATKHNPVFDSVDNAEDWSDDLRALLRAEAVVTALATPSGEYGAPWWEAKVKGAAVELGAVLATQTATGTLKSTAKRDRPDDSNDNSFPSGHASDAFSYATLSNRNLDSIDMNAPLRTGLKAANVALASGVAWARVEGRKHYPSDVLFGAALGHFVTAFVHDAFLGLDGVSNAEVTFHFAPGGAGVAVSWRF